MIIEIKIANKLYKIPALDIDHQKIIELAKKLDDKIQTLSSEINDQDHNTIIIAACLSILANDSSHENNFINKENELDEDEEKYNQEDIYEIISNNYENLSEHIKTLTNKVKSF